MSELSWHQSAHIRKMHQLRNLSAHIHGPDYIATGRMLCGRAWRNCQVTVSPKHAHNPANKTCKQCMAKLIKGDGV